MLFEVPSSGLQVLDVAGHGLKSFERAVKRPAGLRGDVGASQGVTFERSGEHLLGLG
jgi:hypothetical protein